MRVVCLSVCLSAESKSSLVQLSSMPGMKLFWLLFLSSPACNFAPNSFLCVCLCVCVVWVLNAIITMAHRCCYLLHIEPTDSYRACVRAGCIEMKVRRRHKLWLSCVACGSCVTSRHSCYNTCDPYCLTGCQSPSVCYIDSSMSKILKI